MICPNCQAEFLPPEVLEWGGWRVDMRGMTCNGQKVPRKRLEFMRLLVMAKGLVVSHREIGKALGYNSEQGSNIKVAICKLNRQFEGKIRCTYAVGYSLEALV